MPIKDELKKEAVMALKAGEQEKVDALRYLVFLLDKKELSLPPGKMGEKEEVEVLKKELKNKKEVRVMFAQGGRDDLVAQADREIILVEAYLPAQMSQEEVKKVVEEVMTKVGGDNFGAVMGQVMAKVAGKADGGMVAQVVKEKLGEK